MKSRNSLRYQTTSALLSILIVFLIFNIAGPFTSGVTQTVPERVFENTIPDNLPIRIKIKKEKQASFKDLKNQQWMREFELEVLNTGEKPIYYLHLDLFTDVSVNGKPLLLKLEYGRSTLGQFVNIATAADLPINPGDTHYLKIRSDQLAAWEENIDSIQPPQVTKVSVALQKLSFGDRTGFVGNISFPPGI